MGHQNICRITVSRWVNFGADFRFAMDEVLVGLRHEQTLVHVSKVSGFVVAVSGSTDHFVLFLDLGGQFDLRQMHESNAYILVWVRVLQHTICIARSCCYLLTFIFLHM